MCEYGIIEDNASPHNNDVIRDSHRTNGIRLVGYIANESQKRDIKSLIDEQTRSYRQVSACSP